MQRHQRFSAWGATRDEPGTFLVCMGATPGGFELKWEEVPLTREPKQYTIGRSRVTDGKVVGGAVTPTAPTRLNGA
ncbi:MAG TPA: hypothetical protein VEU33_37095 [Archangium sp.]|nr:hypothetical protein [Archangium sp.]